MSARLVLVGLAMATLAGCAQRPGTDTPSAKAPVATAVELPFWVKENGDPNGTALMDHPCGQLSMRTVTTIPAADDLYVDVDNVYEIGPDGRTLRAWRLPVDSGPLAVSGDRLLISHHPGSLWIGVDGRIAPPAAGMAATAEPATAACPTLDQFGDSVYVQCATFRDLESGQPIQLAFEGPCT